MSENQNRPRVEWRNGKCVVIQPDKKTAQKPGQVKKAPVKPAQPPKRTVKPVEVNYNTNDGVSFYDFLSQLKFKRSIVVAVIVIALLSVTVSLLIPLFFTHGNDVDPYEYEISADTQELETDPVEIIIPDTPVTYSTVDDVSICIDPGHGFDDVGTSNDELGVYEHEVNLAVALKLRDKLEAAGMTVYMTHDTNTPPPDAQNPYLFGMKKRNGLANSLSDVKLFISLHCDAFYEDITVSGPRVYHMSDDTGGQEIAENIYTELSELDPDRKVFIKPMSGYNSYQVLRESEMPAVLVEMGFVSNPEEGSAMLTDDWCNSTAQALANAITNAFEDGVIGE
ncbi:MAG: N-acetylmuramoyl-L-alanine amidase [Clostridia bacterium]|nr:N-acetylmuramoyl-L-alanine amidase [Clostridia bacterium]